MNCRRLSAETMIAFMLLFIKLSQKATAIQCFKCENPFGTCNSGQCTGKSCIKLETTNKDKRHVEKGCSEVLEEDACTDTEVMRLVAKRCVCSFDYCNGESELVKSGLIEARVNSASPDRSKRTNINTSIRLGLSQNYLVMLIFLCLFVTGSFSLLIFNTVCVHLC